jgi:hypothetical protein
MTEQNIDFRDTTETKMALLTEFLLQTANSDGFTNSNKILFLYGEENTGVMPILKLALQQVFGENWESNVYLREDKGQKFPYKLHAHKVESSRKVLFVSKSREHLIKWNSLYPHSKTCQFRDIYISPEQQVPGNLPTAMRNFNIDILKQNLKNTLDDFCNQYRLSNSQSIELKGKVLAVLNGMLYGSMD